MTEPLIRISLEIAILIYMITMYCLWKDTGSAKTSETLVEALEAIARRRAAKAARRKRRGQ